MPSNLFLSSTQIDSFISPPYSNYYVNIDVSAEVKRLYSIQDPTLNLQLVKGDRLNSENILGTHCFWPDRNHAISHYLGIFGLTILFFSTLPYC